jgi:hypothetical protein
MSQREHLRVVAVADELEVQTRRVRRFLGMPDDEPTELTFFVQGRIWLAQVTSFESHVRALRKAEGIRGFNGAYQLVNGPLVPELFARYEPDAVDRAWNGRATDANVLSLRAVFLDCDPKRIKGISATDAEKLAAREVTMAVRDLLAARIGAEAIGMGDSGNGYFLLVALEPVQPRAETTKRIGALLALLQRKFGTELVKIDGAVANPARLMPAAGTWKRKGFSTQDRPHRLTSFDCAAAPARVPLEAIA